MVQDFNQVPFSERDIQVQSWKIFQIVADFLEPPYTCPVSHPHKLV